LEPTKVGEEFLFVVQRGHNRLLPYDDAIADIRLALNQSLPLGNRRFHQQMARAVDERREARPRVLIPKKSRLSRGRKEHSETQEACLALINYLSDKNKEMAESEVSRRASMVWTTASNMTWAMNFR
jgi:hypothetical protein